MYRITEKMFALTSESHPLEVNLKCDPIYALELRSIYEGIRAGFHMNKKHWNILTLEESDVTVKYTEKLMSYVKEPKRLVLVGREVYLLYRNGYGKIKLNNNLLENKLKVEARSRNWKSVVKLYELGYE